MSSLCRVVGLNARYLVVVRIDPVWFTGSDNKPTQSMFPVISPGHRRAFDGDVPPLSAGVPSVNHVGDIAKTNKTDRRLFSETNHQDEENRDDQQVTDNQNHDRRVVVVADYRVIGDGIDPLR